MRRILQILAILALAAVSAHAGIVITFDQPSQTAKPGDLLVFMGVISYSAPDTGEIFLNSDDFTSLPSGFTVIDQFFATVPLSLTVGTDSGDIELFDVQVNNPPFGSSTGTYKLRGGVDGSAQDALAQTDFNIVVVPEPSTPALLVAALLVAALRRLRQ